MAHQKSEQTSGAQIHAHAVGLQCCGWTLPIYSHETRQYSRWSGSRASGFEDLSRGVRWSGGRTWANACLLQGARPGEERGSSCICCTQRRGNCRLLGRQPLKAWPRRCVRCRPIRQAHPVQVDEAVADAGLLGLPRQSGRGTAAGTATTPASRRTPRRSLRSSPIQAPSTTTLSPRTWRVAISLPPSASMWAPSWSRSCGHGRGAGRSWASNWEGQCFG